MTVRNREVGRKPPRLRERVQMPVDERGRYGRVGTPRRARILSASAGANARNQDATEAAGKANDGWSRTARRIEPATLIRLVRSRRSRPASPRPEHREIQSWPARESTYDVRLRARRVERRQQEHVILAPIRQKYRSLQTRTGDEYVVRRRGGSRSDEEERDRQGRDQSNRARHGCIEPKNGSLEEKRVGVRRRSGMTPERVSDVSRFARPAR
jgi:hypothetical protein